MSITRSIWFRSRKYSCILLVAIAYWLFIYISRLKRENLHLKSQLSIENDRYSYFKSKSFNTSTNMCNHQILLVIRTSKRTQSSRMPAILKTWFQFSPQTTYITTNGDLNIFHRDLPKQYHHQLHQTKCNQSHTIHDLGCQSASEFEIFFRLNKQYKWLCRFDDDQYVNVPLLIDYLAQFDPEREFLYIGKPSLTYPKQGRGLKFWFATYGGGICFSKALLELIYDDIQPNENFIRGCVASNYPDDTHIAYILQKKYNITLTVAQNFHHHIERDLFVNQTSPSTIDQAITLGFKGNTVPRFMPLVDNDVYHMQTLHCLLYPNRECMRLTRILLNKFYEEKHR